MRVAPLILVTSFVAPAAAQPVTQPSQCQVTIARAPDDVRPGDRNEPLPRMSRP